MESLKFNLAVGDVVPSTSKSVKKENSRKVAVGDVIPSNSNNAKKENSRKKDQINVTKVRLNVNPQAVGLLNGSRTLIFRELTKNVSPFYILNLNRALFMNVSIKEFKELNGLVIVNKYKKITCIGGSKNECLSVIKKYDLWAESLYPEILQTLKDIFEGGKIMINTAQLLGGASRLIKGNQNLIKDFALNITSLFLKIINFSELGVSVAGILDMSLELYRTFCLCEPLIKSELQPEFLLSGIAAAASLVLPKTLFEIFKRMSVFSNAKFLDDVSGLFSLYCTVVEYITTLIDYLPFRCPQMVVDLLNRVSNFAGYGLLYRSKALVNKWRTNRRSMLELDFRNSVTSLNAEIVASEYLTEWARRSPAVNDYLKEFKCLKKATISYESSVRIEPCCFVFEGGPGTSKSITMNNLIQVLGESAYSHIVKPTTDGKDFYDSYNDEEIMFLDDVGQQGISQWRFLINFVSPVKLPLDCANADLKDTKFLTSSKIFITTNRFSTLQGLCKNDGIDCLGALHRRAYVFNYDYVKRVNGVMTGTVQFKYFDLTKGWTHDFPQDFKDYCLMNNLSIPASFNITHRNLHYLAWLAQIVKIFQAVKLQQESDNTLTPEDIQDVKALQSAFELTPESLLECADFAAFYCGVVVGELANIVTNSIDKFVEVYNFLNDSTTLVSKLLITCIASLLFVMASNYMKQKSIISSEMLEVIKGANESPDLMRHPMIESIQRQIFDIQFTDFKQVTTKAVAVFTGRYFITVSHISVMSEGYLVVYKNYAANHRIIDGMKVKLLWRSLDNDCSVWELPNSYPTPFRDISTIYQPSTISYKSYLITPLALCNIENIKPTCPQLPMSYRINADSYTIDQDDIVYKIHYAGMCGSVSVSESGKMLGIHVAGSISGNDLGCSKRFTEADLFEIHSIVSQRAPISLKAKMSQKVIPNFSGMKLDENCNIHSSTKSNIIQSPLYGTFPISRYPAVLDVYGRHTIKDISKKGFNPITTVAHEEILFAQQVIGNIIAPFEDITMYEVIKGTPFLSGLKRDSSNGFNCPKLKTDCVDFEKGELTPSFQLTYDDFLAKIDKGEVEVSDIAWKASLKDELRDPGKIREHSEFRGCAPLY